MLDAAPNSPENIPSESHEIAEAIEALEAKKVELKEAVAYFRKEIQDNLKKFNSSKRVLTKLTESLEKNVRIFHQLFDESKSAIQRSRVSIVNSPIVQRKSSTKVLTFAKTGPSLSLPSDNVDTARRVNQQPTSNRFEKQEQELQPTNESNPAENDVMTNRLATILEESSNSSSAKEVYINLKRLPSSIVNNQSSNKPTNSSLDTSLSSNNSLSSRATPELSRFDAEFASTPLKVEAMRRTPDGKLQNFVIERRKHASLVRKRLVSPKRETLSSSPAKEESRKRLSSTPKSNPVVKKRKSSPEVTVKHSPKAKVKKNELKKSETVKNSPKAKVKKNESKKSEKKSVKKAKSKQKKTKSEAISPKIDSPRRRTPAKHPRQARPKILREESLKKKIRRD